MAKGWEARWPLVGGVRLSRESLGPTNLESRGDAKTSANALSVPTSLIETRELSQFADSTKFIWTP